MPNGRRLLPGVDFFSLRSTLVYSRVPFDTVRDVGLVEYASATELFQTVYRQGGTKLFHAGNGSNY